MRLKDVIQTSFRGATFGTVTLTHYFNFYFEIENMASINFAFSQLWPAELIPSLLENKWRSDRPLKMDGIVNGINSSKNAEGSDLCSVLEAVGQNTSVRVFTLSNLQLGRVEVNNFFSMMHLNSSLTKLELGNVSFNGMDDDDVGKIVVQAFTENTSVQHLKLETCEITSCDTLRDLLTVHPSLRILQLYRLPGIARQLDPATMALPPTITLEQLDICGCSIRDDQIHGLLTTMLTTSSIVSLNLDHNQLGSEWTARIIRNLLLSTNTNHEKSSSRPRLKHLSLQNNNFTGNAIAILASALSENTTLESLRLSNNPMGDDGAKALADALSHNTALRELWASYCEIWHSGCLALCQALPSMSGLTILRVDGNDFESCLPNVLQGIKDNMTLQTFFFADGNYGNDDDKNVEESYQMQRKIQLYVLLNRAKRRILREPQIPCAIWPRVLAGASAKVRTNLARSSSPDVLYYLLRQQPNVFEWQKSYIATRNV